MLDFDLAYAYGIETRALKQAVRRNMKRFEGDDFMFEVTSDELSRSQFVTMKKGRGNNIKYKPFAFTELGVAMLTHIAALSSRNVKIRLILHYFRQISFKCSCTKDTTI